MLSTSSVYPPSCPLHPWSQIANIISGFVIPQTRYYTRFLYLSCVFLPIIRNDSFRFNKKPIILNVSSLLFVDTTLYAILNATECRHTGLVLRKFLQKKKNKIDMSVQSYIEIGPNPNSLRIPKTRSQLKSSHHTMCGICEL